MSLLAGSVLETWHGPCPSFDELTIFNTHSEYLLEASNLDSIKCCIFAEVSVVLNFCESEQLSVERALFAAFNLFGVRLALTWVYSAHMTTEGLASAKVLIAFVTVEVDK